MDINELYPSNFLKAADLKGQPRTLTIQAVAPETIGDNETKPVMRFVGMSKGLVLNKTNGMLLASTLGPETDAWIGKPIELYSEKVQFQGRIVDAIRVRESMPAPAAAAPQPVPQPVPQPAPAEAQPAPAADVPFPAGAEGAGATQTVAAPAAAQPDFDDDIPW